MRELGRDGGRCGPVAPGPRPWESGTLMEGVGGRMDDEVTVAEDGGLTEVLLLLDKPQATT